MELGDFFSKDNFLKIREEVLEWLPEKIVDAHVHTATKVEKEKHEFLKRFKIAREILGPGLWDNDKVYRRLFLDKEVLSVGFGLPLVRAGVDVENVNNLAIERMKEGIMSCMLFSRDITLLEKALKGGEESGVKFSGVKLHPWLFNEDNFSIKKYFSEAFLGFCEKNQLAIICELPDGWTDENIDILREILKKFKIKIVVPHLGFNNRGFVMSYDEYMENMDKEVDEFRKAFQKIGDIKNLYLDTSMIINQAMVNAVFEILGDERILWGSDYPYGFTPKVSEVRPKTEELAEALKRIVLGVEFEDIWRYDFWVYLQIQTIKNYFDKYDKSSDALEKVFRSNAKKVYGF